MQRLDAAEERRRQQPQLTRSTFSIGCTSSDERNTEYRQANTTRKRRKQGEQEEERNGTAALQAEWILVRACLLTGIGLLPAAVPHRLSLYSPHTCNFGMPGLDIQYKY
eukprot:2483282-Rhodomonas_salina.5